MILTVYSILLVYQLNWVGLLAPLLVMAITFTQNRMTNRQSKHEAKVQALRAKRTNKVEETINGIKIVKFNAWEKERLQKLDSLRKKEHQGIFKLFIFYGLNDVMNALNTPLITLVCFWIYSALYGELTTAEIYSLLALVSGLDSPLRFLIYARLYRSKAMIFCKNYAKLLGVGRQGVQKDSNELKKGEIVIKDGDFHWNNTKVEKIFKGEKSKKRQKTTKNLNSVGDSNESESGRELKPEENLVLKEINLHIQPGEFVGVIGKVGSGKSSLLKAFTNEILKSRGDVQKNGSIALIPQESFLINDTVKNNILFGSPYNEERYQKALTLSELREDLEILRAGDSTQIGERGINLSGGQKQRVCIARALYSHSDVYLIDDSLSALDAHVGHSVMQNAFKRELSGKTRVMVTHQLKLLKEFDRVVLMNLGKITSEGTYDEIKDLPEFKEFYQEAIEKENYQDEGLQTQTRIEEMKENSNHEENESNLPRKAGSKIILNPIDHQLLKSELKGNKLHKSSQKDSEDKKATLNGQEFSSNSSEGCNQTEDLNLSKKEKCFTNNQKTAEKERIQQGKITSQEKKSKGVVSLATYSYYAKRLGIFKISLICIAFACSVAWVFALDYFISVWMNNGLKLKNKGLYPLIYIGMILIFVTILGLRTLIYGATFSRGGYLLLKETIYNIFRRKMSFFDTTPIGQIITRTSDDGYIVDLMLPRGILFCLTPLFMLLGICTIILVVSLLQVVVIIPIVVLMGRSIKRFSTVSVEFQRMMRLASAPLISTLSELMKGVASLRVYDRLGYLVGIARRRCDAYTATLLHEGMFYQWIVDSIETLGTALILFTLWFITLGKMYK